MKYWIVGLLLFFCFSNAYSQGTTGGIRFEQGLSWEQVKNKAKAENKHLFVECYTTWCAPCKVLDKNVFSKENVGKFMNEHFISVKVQIDTSKVDKQGVKDWYEDARSLKLKYTVSMFPTYLFFSPEGEIVHRDVRVVNDTQFLRIALNSLTPRKQYYTMVKNYKRGIKDFGEMPYLADLAKSIGDEDLANKLAQDYINSYLLRLPEKQFYTQENVEFVGRWMKSSKEKGFKIFYRNSTTINRLVKWMNNYSEAVTDIIITKEEIDPFLQDDKLVDKTPDWSNITKAISIKYGLEAAHRNILSAKLRYYEQKKKWPEFIKVAIEKITKYGIDTTSLLNEVYLNNNIIWNGIFLKSTDKRELEKAIGWMEDIIRRHPNDPQFLDTYANLLYKIGRTDDAVEIETRVIELDPKEKGFQETLKKMKAGVETW